MRLFTDVSSAIADPFLRRAWLLAENARGATSPNPLVGCVLVRDGVVVGEGWHQRAGEPHAEVMAMRVAGERARGAVAYVTLEPCAHSGRTGPCALSLADAGIARVVVGMRDPNPFVAGGGAEVLRSRGVEVVIAQDPRPYEAQNEAWLHWLRTGRPFVQAKIALTLDGRPALREGAAASISGRESRAVTMRLRSAADAILVGARTLNADDPQLTVRDEQGGAVGRQPLRVVLAGREPLRPSSRVFAGDSTNTLVLAQTDLATPLPKRVTEVRYDGGLADALTLLGGREVVRLLVEPGPRLLTSLVEAGLIDELVVYHAPGFGGREAPAAFLGAVADSDTLVRRFRLLECGAAGEDAVTVWRPRTGA